MIEVEKKELRAFYIKDYKIKTGCRLTCIESGIRPVRMKNICRLNILAIASKYTGIPEQQIVSKSRSTKLVEVRRMIIAIMRTHKIIYEDIAAIIGQTNHSNSVTMIGVHNNYCSVDMDYKFRYKKMSEYCKEELLKIHNTKKKINITSTMIIDIQQLYMKGENSIDIIAKQYNIHKDTVSKIVNGRYKK